MTGKRRRHRDGTPKTVYLLEDSPTSSGGETKRNGERGSVDESNEVDFSDGVRGKYVKKFGNLDVYTSGLFHCSVCTDITDKEEILIRLNAEHPCGTDNGWMHSKDSRFASGAPNPGPCELHEGRMHYLMDA